VRANVLERTFFRALRPLAIRITIASAIMFLSIWPAIVLMPSTSDAQSEQGYCRLTFHDEFKGQAYDSSPA